MTTTQFLDEVVAVTSTINNQGQVDPTQLSRRSQTYAIISVGRQWDTEEGRHILVETSDGARLELQLSRADLLWRLKRAWPIEMAA